MEMLKKILSCTIFSMSLCVHVCSKVEHASPVFHVQSFYQVSSKSNSQFPGNEQTQSNLPQRYTGSVPFGERNESRIEWAGVRVSQREKRGRHSSPLAQSGPRNPAKQWQCPATHSPFPLQSVEQPPIVSAQTHKQAHNERHKKIKMKLKIFHERLHHLV